MLFPVGTLDVPEPLTTSIRDNKQLIPEHFYHVNLLIIKYSFTNVNTQLVALKRTE